MSAEKPTSYSRFQVTGGQRGDGGWGLTEVLFPQKRDNSGPKLEGKENPSMAQVSNHAWVTFRKKTAG